MDARNSEVRPCRTLPPDSEGEDLVVTPEERTEAMASGTVKWFDAEKGFGFIQQDNGPDVYAHFSAIQAHGYRSLEENQRVEFEIVQGPKGPQADQIQVVG